MAYVSLVLQVLALICLLYAALAEVARVGWLGLAFYVAAVVLPALVTLLKS